jgi:hypothetical protein
VNEAQAGHFKDDGKATTALMCSLYSGNYNIWTTYAAFGRLPAGSGFSDAHCPCTVRRSSFFSFISPFSHKAGEVRWSKKKKKKNGSTGSVT